MVGLMKRGFVAQAVSALVEVWPGASEVGAVSQSVQVEAQEGLGEIPGWLGKCPESSLKGGFHWPLLQLILLS